MMKNLTFNLIVLSIFVMVTNALGTITTISYWKMDDWTSRTIFADAIGNYNLTKHSGGVQSTDVAVNPVPNPDPLVGGENLKSYLTVRANTSEPVTAFNMTDSSSFTFEGWFKWTGATAGNALAATRSAEWNSTGWDLILQKTGRLDLRMQNESGVSSYVNTGANVLSTNTWYHIALVWDHAMGDSGTASIYFDGILVGSGAGNGDLGGGAKAFYIGGRDDVANGVYRFTGLGFNGYMDELRFSDGALSPSQFLVAPEPSTIGLLSIGFFLVKRKHMRLF